MTQGMITIMKNGKVYMKIIAGCDGYNVGKVLVELKKEIRFRKDISPDIAYCLTIRHMGSKECLVIMTENSVYPEDLDDLPKLYRETFNEPSSNPRWTCKKVGYFKLLDMDKELNNTLEN